MKYPWIFSFFVCSVGVILWYERYFLGCIIRKNCLFFDISRSFISTFTASREGIFTRCEKYSSKLNFVEFRPRSVEKINFLYILSLKLDIISLVYLYLCR